MDEFWRETFRPLVAPLRAVRFSLATLLLAVFFVASIIAVWVNREPWEIAAKVKLPEFPQGEPVHLNPLAQDGEILIERNHKDHRLTVWDWRSDRVRPVEFPDDEMLLETAPAAGRFLTADKSGTARVRQIGSALPLLELPHWVFPTAANPRISQDGNRIAASGPDGTVWLYDLDEQKETSFPTHIKATKLVYLEFSGDGHWLQVMERDLVQPEPETLSDMVGHAAFSLIDCRLRATVRPPDDVEKYIIRNWLLSHSFSGDADRVFSYQKYWRIGTSQLQDSPGVKVPWVSATDQEVQSAAFATAPGPIELWSTDMTQRRGSVEVSALPEGHTGLATTRDNRLVVWTDTENEMASALFDIRTGQLVHRLPSRVLHFLGENHILSLDRAKGEAQVWRRRRPEYAWGLLALPEFWLVPIFLTATIFSIRRDRRIGKSVAA